MNTGKYVGIFLLGFIFDFVYCLGKLNKISDGKYAITGRGCGTHTKIKYLSKIPENLDENQCAVIIEDLKPAQNNFPENTNPILETCVKTDHTFVDGSIEEIPMSSQNKCFEKCKGTLKCTGFTWVVAEKVCILKNDLRNLIPNSGHNSAIMDECNVKRCFGDFIEKHTINDPALKVIYDTTPENCLEECKAEPSCIGAVMVSGVHCHLKNTINDHWGNRNGHDSVFRIKC